GFEAIGSGPFAVRLDGQPLVASAPQVPDEPVSAAAARQLSAGEHPIEVEYDSSQPAHTTRRIFQLFWTPPGGTQQLISPTTFVRREYRQRTQRTPRLRRGAVVGPAVFAPPFGTEGTIGPTPPARRLLPSA